MGFIEKASRALMYVPQSPLCSLDPIIKLVYAVVTVAVSFIVKNPILIAVLLGFNLMLAFKYKLGGRVASLFVGIAPFILMIFLINTLFTYFFSSVRYSVSSLLLFYAVVSMRVLVALVAFTLFIATTTPQELLYLLSGRLGVDYRLVYPLVIAYRFIPLLFMELQSIYDAQRSRGVSVDSGGVFTRLKSLASLIIPSIICSIIRARDLAEAMESRCFGSSSRRFYSGFYRKQKLIDFWTAFATAFSLSILVVSYVVL